MLDNPREMISAIIVDVGTVIATSINVFLRA